MLERISLLGDRANNQDRAATYSANGRLLLALADGMGGHSDGAAAAQCVMDVAQAVFHEDPTLPAPRLLQQIALKAHLAIATLHPHADERQQPRTTVVFCLVQANYQALFAHAGDSRAYLLRDNQIAHRTRDHSVVETLIRRGEITAEQARVHPRRHQVSRCLGGLSRPPALEFTPCPALKPGDALLLCSDGLWGPLTDTEIAKDTPLDKLARAAVARQPGRADNCTALRLRLQRV